MSLLFDYTLINLWLITFNMNRKQTFKFCQCRNFNVCMENTFYYEHFKKF